MTGMVFYKFYSFSIYSKIISYYNFSVIYIEVL